MNASSGHDDNGSRMKAQDRANSESADDRSGKHDRLIARLLADSEKQEALGWLKNDSPDDERTVGGCKTNPASVQFIQEIYNLGALQIFAINIRPNRNGKGQYTGKLIVQLPIETEPREALFNWCKRQGDSLGFSPDPDRGESHLYLLLD